MSNNAARDHEMLYLVTLRNDLAESLLRTWLKTSPHNKASVDGNRLKIFDHHTWHRFRVTWPHSFDQVAVWDAWNRRHLYLI